MCDSVILAGLMKYTCVDCLSLVKNRVRKKPTTMEIYFSFVLKIGMDLMGSKTLTLCLVKVEKSERKKSILSRL